MTPLVAVQILVHNESKETIDRLMASLCAVDYPRDRWHLTIVNNVCAGHDLGRYLRDRWAHDARLPETTVEVQDPNLGFAGGHNRALERSRRWAPDYVYLLNADAHVDPAFLTRAVEVAQANPALGIVQSRLMLAQSPDLLNSAGNALHFLGFGFSIGYKIPYLQITDPYRFTDGKVPLFYASGAAILIRASMPDRIGGLFDASYFMYHEDVDLSWRARLAGWGIAVAPDSIVYHHYEFSKSIKKFYWMERNRHLTHLALLRWRTLILLKPAYLAMELGTFLFALKGGWVKEKMRAWAHLYKPSTWKWIFERRGLAARIRTVSDREILAHMSGVIVNQEVDNPLLTRVVNPLFDTYLRLLRLIVRW